MNEQLLSDCVNVLEANWHDDHTMPAPHLYPHQWLWDSCFIAIGLRHTNPKRAVTELKSLIRGQWSNGMIAEMVFDKAPHYQRDREIWQSWQSPFSPDKYATTGITQPAMVAEAVWLVGEKLKKEERLKFFKSMLPHLIAHHEWLYRERDPHGEGLTLQIHPYEVGLDNTPPWMNQLREHHRPWWVDIIVKLHLVGVVNMIRRDTKRLPPGTRMSTLDAMIVFDVIRRLRRKAYDVNKILHRSLFSIEDLTFNSIFIRANSRLCDIAELARHKLPDGLMANMKKSEAALEELWDPQTKSYYSRDFITHQLLKEPSIAAFMPLYSGAISKERAEVLVGELKDTAQWWLNFPVPSVPISSNDFSPMRYWQGPTWINTNWLIIDGLRRYGYEELADELSKRTIDLVGSKGIYEYYSPTDGAGYGAKDFSWTAALTIDLVKS